jgi:hypothetical protein
VIEPIIVQGNGNAVEVLTRPLEAGEIVTMTHSGGSNFAIWAESAQGDRLELLVNTIGDYTGTVLFEDSSPAALLNITAGGAWTVEITSILQAQPWDGNGELSGTGDQVVAIFNGLDELKVVDITHSGTSNFAIWVYNDSSRRELLVNEIGPYTGSGRLVAGTLVIAIKASGPWTITSR